MTGDPQNDILYGTESERLRGKLGEKLTRLGISDEEIEFLLLTFDLASEIHEGESRTSGRIFLYHPYEVGDYLIEIGMDHQTIAAGLLHDTAEAFTEKNGMNRQEALNFVKRLYRKGIESSTKSRLLMGSIPEVMLLVSALTRDCDEVYYESIDRIFSLDPVNRSKALITKAGGDRRFNVQEMDEFDTQRKLYSIFKSFYIAHEMKRLFLSGEEISLRPKVERSFEDLITYTNVVVGSILSEIQQKYERDPEMGRKLIELEYEADRYQKEGGFSRITYASEESTFDGTIEKYDRLIRKEIDYEDLDQSYEQLYADALGLKRVLTLLLIEPDYLIEGFEWREIKR